MTGICLPNELLILIFSNINHKDMSKIYFSLRPYKDILDYVIDKYRIKISFQIESIFKIIIEPIKINNKKICVYKSNRVTNLELNNFVIRQKLTILKYKCYEYDNIIDNIYQNEKLSIKLWDKICIVNNNNKYIKKILKQVLTEYKPRHYIGLFTESDIRETHSLLFFKSMVTLQYELGKYYLSS